jgi:hypothetical protein
MDHSIVAAEESPSVHLLRPSEGSAQKNTIIKDGTLKFEEK